MAMRCQPTNIVGVLYNGKKTIRQHFILHVTTSRHNTTNIGIKACFSLTNDHVESTDDVVHLHNIEC